MVTWPETTPVVVALVAHRSPWESDIVCGIEYDAFASSQKEVVPWTTVPVKGEPAPVELSATEGKISLPLKEASTVTMYWCWYVAVIVPDELPESHLSPEEEPGSGSV
jgi:hypothetical protein